MDRENGIIVHDLLHIEVDLPAENDIIVHSHLHIIEVPVTIQETQTIVSYHHLGLAEIVVSQEAGRSRVPDGLNREVDLDPSQDEFKGQNLTIHGREETTTVSDQDPKIDLFHKVGTIFRSDAGTVIRLVTFGDSAGHFSLKTVHFKEEEITLNRSTTPDGMRHKKELTIRVSMVQTEAHR